MTLGSEMATSQPPGPNMGPNNTSSQMATNEPNDLAALPPTVEGEDMPAKRKATTSFKITNVFLSRPPSNDGDDSCEDGEELEDSRTEVSASYLSQNSVDSGISAERGKYTMCVWSKRSGIEGCGPFRISGKYRDLRLRSRS